MIGVSNSGQSKPRNPITLDRLGISARSGGASFKLVTSGSSHGLDNDGMIIEPASILVL